MERKSVCITVQVQYYSSKVHTVVKKSSRTRGKKNDQSRPFNFFFFLACPQKLLFSFLSVLFLPFSKPSQRLGESKKLKVPFGEERRQRAENAKEDKERRKNK